MKCDLFGDKKQFPFSHPCLMYASKQCVVSGYALEGWSLEGAWTTRSMLTLNEYSFYKVLVVLPKSVSLYSSTTAVRKGV
jgi:hypothetical protein